MKRTSSVTVLGVGLLAMSMMVGGCSSGGEDTDSGSGAVSTNGSAAQSAADGAGPLAPLEKKSFDLPITLSAHNSLNLADELKKAVGASELTFANGAAKVELDPSSVLTLNTIDIGGSIQYTQGSVKKFLSLLEGHVGATATAKVKANVTYSASFQGQESKDFHMDFGTPLTKSIDVQWTDGGVVHHFPVNVTINTGATVGCSLSANDSAKASLGAEVDFKYQGSLSYNNPTGGVPIASVPLTDLFSFESTNPSDILTLKPIDMGAAQPTYFTADASVHGTASCWVRPEVTVNVFNFIGLTAGANAELDATVGAEAKASSDSAAIPGEFDWTLTPKVTLQAWGTAGIGTTQVAKTDTFKLGEFSWQKPYAGKYEGDLTFDPTTAQ
jgi:hypothetical protein